MLIRNSCVIVSPLVMFSALCPCPCPASLPWTVKTNPRTLKVSFTAIRALDELNPQNVPSSEVVPSRQLNPLQALTAQLEAISKNDHPWNNHGVQTMYEFAADAGSMERSRYFGFSKDLYHFDHFLHFKTACAALVDCQSYSVLPGIPEQLLTASQQQQKQHSAGISQSSASHGPHLPGSEEFYVSVTDSKGSDGGVFKFVLVQQDFGLKQGCWMTKSCFKVL